MSCKHILYFITRTEDTEVLCCPWNDISTEFKDLLTYSLTYLLAYLLTVKHSVNSTYPHRGHGSSLLSLGRHLHRVQGLAYLLTYLLTFLLTYSETKCLLYLPAQRTRKFSAVLGTTSPRSSRTCLLTYLLTYLLTVKHITYLLTYLQ